MYAAGNTLAPAMVSSSSTVMYISYEMENAFKQPMAPTSVLLSIKARFLPHL